MAHPFRAPGDLPALPSALGIYLLFSTMAAVSAGGLVRGFAERGGPAGGPRTGILCRAARAES